VSFYKESRKTRRERIKGKKYGLLLNFAMVSLEGKRIVDD